ncbi:G/U mismatch-specific DNA glycosylase [Sphaerisporangium dianthi]|uniref:G/U mismatch-specific DNA glycosylase n=1 Tax=Sphaerisporangium dianthi TaxID=1436120 RepID=A0ABV9CIA3_9ACTN
MTGMKADLEAARERTVEDVVGPGTAVMFCGINPGLYSAATGRHFARPGNRFWPALHLSGFTPRLLRPSEQHLLPSYGLGVTNLVPRATAKAAELSAEELRLAPARLTRLACEAGLEVLAVVGVSAYRVAFGRPKAAVGPSDDMIGPARLWILPNPSGLNAHYTLPALAAEFRRLRETTTLPETAPPS